MQEALSKSFPTGRSPFLGGLFLVCMCVLMLQIVETRVLSVIAYYYLAFFAIGMAMFGMTAGSLLVFVAEKRFSREMLFENLVWISCAFAAAIFLSALVLVTTVLIDVQHKPDISMAALEWGKAVVVLASPYVFAGMAVSLALTRSPWPVPLVYGVDLAGGAVGCLAVLLVLTLVDAVSALFLIAALAASAGALFKLAKAGAPNAAALRTVGAAALFKRPWILAAALLGVAVANASIQPWGIRLSVVKDAIESIDTDTQFFWNSFSRISVGPETVSQPEMWGASQSMPSFRLSQRHLAIDGSAASPLYKFDGDLSKLSFLDYDITNIAYSIRKTGRAAIVGVGGGRDLLSAARAGFHDITGVELNPVFVQLLSTRLRKYNHLADLTGVRFFVDDGRSWFARSQEHFDLIQMSMVDTWAATGAGAFSLSENGLYTVEGWRVFFRHLAPNGVFTVSRWYAPRKLAETGRMMSVAVAALLQEGVPNPPDHLILVVNGRLATLIVSHAPFTSTEIRVLSDRAKRLGFVVVLAPKKPAVSPVLSEILSAHEPGFLKNIGSDSDLDLSPAYDDRPFFFQILKMTPRAISGAFYAESDLVRGNLRANTTLVLIVLISVSLVIGTILLPFRGSVRQVETRLALFGSLYFMFIGIGFMLVEIGIIQRISVYLGHPIYGLAIGLFGIIASTGIGSLISGYVPLSRQERLLAWALSIGVFLLALPYGIERLADIFSQASLPVRAAVSLAAIIPSGLLMGFGFPTGMRIVSAIDPGPTPWLWAINGAAGVLASGAAVITSIVFSISTTIWCGAACYLLIAPLSFWFSLSNLKTGAKNLTPSAAVPQS